MKVSFEIAREASAKNGITGRSLTPPYSAAALRVRAEDVRGIQEFRALAEKLNRSYDAQTVDNFTRDLRGTYGSATSEIIPSK